MLYLEVSSVDEGQIAAIQGQSKTPVFYTYRWRQKMESMA